MGEAVEERGGHLRVTEYTVRDYREADSGNGFTDPDILGGGNISDAVKVTVPLLAFFRERHSPVAFTRIVYADDGSDASVWCQKAPRLRDLTEPAHDSQVVSELAPRKGELVIHKTQASAFLERTCAPF